MSPVISLPIAFGICSICFGGILALNFLAAIVDRHPGAVDKTDSWLIWFLCVLLTILALRVLSAAIFG